MRQYLFIGLSGTLFLSGCSNDDLKNSQSFEQDPLINQDINELAFLPTITNLYGRDHGTITYRSASLDGIWGHEYDNTGRLSKSVMYERYPSRILKQINYSNYSEDNLEMDLEIITFTYYYGFPRTYTLKNRLYLNEDFLADRISDVDEDREGYQSFDELNSRGNVTKLGKVLEDNVKVWTTNYEYDDDGNVTKYFTEYHPNNSQDAMVVYSYTEAGDLKTYDFHNEEGLFSNVEYTYRGDNTLEGLNETFRMRDENAGSRTILYDENEAYKEQRILYLNGSKTISSYTENQIIEQYYRPGDILKEIWKYIINEDYIYCEQIEYYDEEGNLDYTEYYDEEGNLIETIYE
ncbi:hypothetical protein [Christiangramia sabulilitoris]|uniref:Uncharacterized protein n=1 Tax=Christiangramia sabulilitoris TaxID=2583991 RepID=A0A550I7X1_9FLAO|nr:hypothetical protein [Christiangramia sabulilitoris]TRO66918.1 hypothetical protein FGM01_03230 [Christiangramia sabulilitoris]